MPTQCWWSLVEKQQYSLMAITEISWKGMRCYLEVSGGSKGMKADLRLEAAGASVATMAKSVDDGGARLLVEDDDLEGEAVVAVLLSSRPADRPRTVVGGDDA